MPFRHYILSWYKITLKADFGFVSEGNYVYVMVFLSFPLTFQFAHSRGFEGSLEACYAKPAASFISSLSPENSV